MNKVKEILAAIKTKDTLTACIIADNPLIGNEFIITVGGGISAFLMGSHRKTQTPAGKASE